jgi:hypothetical protein
MFLCRVKFRGNSREKSGNFAVLNDAELLLVYRYPHGGAVPNPLVPVMGVQHGALFFRQRT